MYLFFQNKNILLNTIAIIILSISAIVYGNRAPALEILVIGGIFLCYHFLEKSDHIMQLLDFSLL